VSTVEDEAAVAGPLARRAAALTAILATGLLALTAVLVVPWDWVPGGDLRPLAESQMFTPAEIARAEAFSSGQRYLGWASYALSLLFALALGLTSLGSRLLRRLQGRLRWWLAVPLGVLALLTVGRLLTLPLSLAAHHRNLDYGLSGQSWPAWSVDILKSLGVSWVFTALLALLVVAAARRSPRLWFAWAGGAAAVLTVGGSFLYPVAVEPLFNRFTSMEPGAFKTSVLALAERQGVEVDDVLVADASRRTTTLNAYVSGLGGTRRVVVYDNLLADLPPNQARVVIAHEMAHAENRDVAVGTLLGAIGSVLGVAVLALALDSRWLRRRTATTGAADPASLAALVALVAVGAVVSSPAQNLVSRAVEARADRDSISATGADRTFVSVQQALAVSALHDPNPPRWSQVWFGSHPTALERGGLPRSLRDAR